MAEAKLAPNLPDWMVEHANRYRSSGGTDGHMYKMTQPGRPEMTVPSLLLTTKGRKSGEKFVFPLFYGVAGDSYFVVASKGGAPQHPGWFTATSWLTLWWRYRSGPGRCRRGHGPPRRREDAALGRGAEILAALCRLSAQDRTRDPGGRVRSRALGVAGHTGRAGVVAPIAGVGRVLNPGRAKHLTGSRRTPSPKTRSVLLGPIVDGALVRDGVELWPPCIWQICAALRGAGSPDRNTAWRSSSSSRHAPRTSTRW